ncbi:DNA damage-binding protein 1a [Coemansia sp. RSA 990]|nr:DNA damage-binding protein 1a [Coemansia sp. RSA 990]
MQYQYVVSAYKASSVSKSTNGAFTSPQACNLIVAKNNQLQVFQFAAGRLEQVGSWTLYGKIASLHFIHPKDRLTGVILVTSEKYQFAVLSWNAADQRIVTESTGEFVEVTGRPSTESKLVAVDPWQRVIAVYAYQGIVHLLPLVSDPQSHSIWKTLLRVTSKDKSTNTSIGGLSTQNKPYPYAVHQNESGLMIPKYLQPDTNSTEFIEGANRTKGKATAYSERSTDIYPILTRYIHELKVLDMQFLHGSSDEQPTFAVLYEDANMQRHVHAYRLGEAQGEMQPLSLWSSLSLEAAATKLIPLLGGEVMVVGDESLAVVGPSRQPLGMSKRAAAVTAWTWIDANACTRLLLADEHGVLSLVVLEYGGADQHSVQDIFIERLGSTSVATSLSYLGDGCVYIGSHCGDQMLVRLHTQPLSPETVADASRRTLCLWGDNSDIDGSMKILENPLSDTANVSKQQQAPKPSTFVEPLQLYENLAPMVDLCIVGMGESTPARNTPADTLANGSKREAGGSYGSVVSCSGMANTPGLRVVRNGIGIGRLYGIDLAGVMGLWSLTIAQPVRADESAMDLDKPEEQRTVLLVVSLIDCTLLLGWTEPAGEQIDVAEMALGGWRLSESTLATCLSRSGRHVVQVTRQAVLLIDSARWAVQTEWKPENGAGISAASVCGDQVAVAVNGNMVVYFEKQQDVLKQVACRQLDKAIACIDVHAWDVDSGTATHVAVGLWAANDVCLLALPDLVPVETKLSLDMPQGTSSDSSSSSKSGGLPRSVLMSTLGGTPYLLVGLGDGYLHQFALSLESSVAVCEHKAIALGSGPLLLTPFINHGKQSVFAASDHSAVLFAETRSRERQDKRVSKLIYASVDVRGIKRMAPVDSQAMPMAMCVVSDMQLWVGQADPVQQLHVRSHPLPRWAAPHRIAHCEALSAYAVASIHSLDSEAPWADSAADAAVWESQALLNTNAQQAKLLDSDVTAILAAGGPPAEIGRFSILDSQTMGVLGSVLLRPFEMPESLCSLSLKRLPRPESTAASENALQPAGAAFGASGNVQGWLDNVFVLGTSIVLPGEDDARRGRVLLCGWDFALHQIRIVGSFTALGAVYSVVPFRGMLLAAVNGRLLLLGWQRRASSGETAAAARGKVGSSAVLAEDADYELVVLCSQQTQITALSISTNGDYIAVGDVMSSVSLYHYEEYMLPPAVAAATSSISTQQQQARGGTAGGQLRHRLVPVSRDYSGVWTTAIATVAPPLEQNREHVYPDPIDAETGFLARQGGVYYASAFRNLSQERFVVADAYSNLIRVSRAEDVPSGDAVDGSRMYVEARWHLGDMVNVIRPGSLVMDIPDPEFPGVFRPLLIYGTLHGAVGVITSVENGKLGRILDRLQTNMAHLLPTPGLWDYSQWRGFSSDQRSTQAFGFLDGDLIEQFLDLPAEMQQQVFVGGSGELAIDEEEYALKNEYWNSYSRIEAEGNVAVLSQMAVSNIGQREDISLEYLIRLVESLTRLH